MGGDQEIVWLSRFDTLGEYESSTDKIQSDQHYQAQVKAAIDKGYFAPHSIKTALWRTI